MRFPARLVAAILLCLNPACSQVPKGYAPVAAPDAGLDPELTNFEYPRPVQFFPLKSQQQEMRMAYLRVVPTNPNGRTVLLLHGKNFSAASWEPTIRALVREGFEVLAPDQIGFGKSSKPESYQFSFHALADNTRSLLDSLGVGRVAVVGHSMGGMLAVRFALMYPDRVESLALVNPIGLEDWKTKVPYKPVGEHYGDELKKKPEGLRTYQRENYFFGEWKPEYEELIRIPSGWIRHRDYPRVAWNAALTTDMIFTQPVLYEFPLLKPRTLLLIGTRDRTAIGKGWAPPEAARTLGLYSELGRKAAKAIPRAKLVELPESGHLPQVDDFGAYLKALVQFLNEGPR